MDSRQSYFVVAGDHQRFVGHYPVAWVVGPIRATSAVEAVQQLVDITGEHGDYYAIAAGDVIRVSPKAEPS